MCVARRSRRQRYDPAVTAARTAAARWRGGFVAACSATLAIAAHGYGGGMPPSGGPLVLLVLGAVLTGVAAGTRTAALSIPLVALYLVAGQAAGHLILNFASAHAHTVVVSPRMLVAHLIAAVLCAALICAAERLGAAVANRVRVLCRARPGDHEHRSGTTCPAQFEHGFVRRVYLRCCAGRAPPACAAA
jgi:hypothetical protein